MSENFRLLFPCFFVRRRSHGRGRRTLPLDGAWGSGVVVFDASGGRLCREIRRFRPDGFFGRFVSGPAQKVSGCRRGIQAEIVRRTFDLCPDRGRVEGVRGFGFPVCPRFRLGGSFFLALPPPSFGEVPVAIRNGPCRGRRPNGAAADKYGKRKKWGAYRGRWGGGGEERRGDVVPPAGLEPATRGLRIQLR